jgi:CDP-paratose 2-epimerase
VRDIVYATDVARAFLAFYDRGEAGIYNVGGGRESMISLLECIDLIDRTTGRPSHVEFQDARFGDLQYFVCDIDRARKGFGWEPSVRPEEGVPRLLEWVEANRSLFAGEAGA